MATSILSLPLIECAMRIARNEDWLDGFEIKDTDGDPVNLTGIRMDMQVRRAATDPQVLLEASTITGRIVTGGASNNVLAFVILKELVAGFPLSPNGQPFVFDIVATADGHTVRFCVGTVEVTRGITQGVSTLR